MGGQKLGDARNSNKAKSGVSQIHFWQLFHFINVRCNYFLQLSLSYPRFRQTSQNRRFFVLRNRLEGGVLSKIGSKGEFLSEIDSKGEIFSKIWEVFYKNDYSSQSDFIYPCLGDQVTRRKRPRPGSRDSGSNSHVEEASELLGCRYIGARAVNILNKRRIY